VSFSVDPERDTPPVLAAYAKSFSASPDRWFFLTGPAATLQLLDRRAFLLGDVGGQLEHSTRFVLVDKQSRVRGYYDSLSQEEMEKLKRDALRLAKEPA
jgi:cytochrome oxidase Cu insertion factor (SCO1/SenC/PrrC family)